ncbi:acetyl-CoA hydrolase/transferase C-terminal domain-containing protein [Nocardia sp. R6R-6]|uniref:acetyl-CoA hydrolase/transferase C-terminal domain-containing protein n=1 Tax=Nocardia sp. R6R-6 TaxID=3459303 RepID=UPI00403D73B8
MIDLRPHIRAGSGVRWNQAGAEPTPLVNALVEQVGEIGPIRAFAGLTWNRAVTHDPPPLLSVTSYGGLGELSTLSKHGLLDVVPCHYSALPRLFAEGALPSDVGLLQVSPPDATGNCSMGIGVDYIADAVEHTPVLIAEINRQMPVTRGAPTIPLSRFTATIGTDRPLLEAAERRPDEVERRIARHVASLVRDGDTIQIGVGTLPAAVLFALESHDDLGMHSGMIADDVLRLIDKGVLTGARKEIDTGMVITGTAIGTSKLYERVGAMPIGFRPASYTHDPSVLVRLRSLVSINSAIEVDLTGQVGAERRGRIYAGAVAGQTDFTRAASLTGARSIIAMRAARESESNIKARLEYGSVTTARADVDFVVTEFGIAALRGLDLGGRARQLISVAAPEHREELERATHSRRS